MARKIESVLYVLQIVFLLMIAYTALQGLGYWLRVGSRETVVEGLYYTIWNAGLFALVVYLKWLVGLATRGTFSLAAFMLALGCFYLGTYLRAVYAYERIEYFHGAIQWAFAFIFFAVGLYLLVSHVIWPSHVLPEIDVDRGRIAPTVGGSRGIGISE